MVNLRIVICARLSLFLIERLFYFVFSFALNLSLNFHRRYLFLEGLWDDDSPSSCRPRLEVKTVGDFKIHSEPAKRSFLPSLQVSSPKLVETRFPNTSGLDSWVFLSGSNLVEIVCLAPFHTSESPPNTFAHFKFLFREYSSFVFSITVSSTISGLWNHFRA